jgi:hypothetical protein
MGKKVCSGCLRDPACAMLCEITGQWCQGEPLHWETLDEAGWKSLAEQSIARGVAGLLYTLLPDGVPDSVREMLRAEYNSQLAANVIYMQQLARVAPALKDAGVRFVAVKGSALLATVYPDLGIRFMKDIDLLVHPEDVSILKPVMQHLGWEEEDEDIAGKHFGERYRAETSFTRREGSWMLRLEAHLDAPGFYPPSRRSIWDKVTTVCGAGIEELPVLNLPAHLSYLCAHYYYHHCGSGLKWLVDVALLVSQISSWREVVVDAYQFGTTRPVHLALLEVAKYLGIRVPQHIVETLRFLPMPLSLRLLYEMCKRPSLHYLGIRLLDLYRAPNWSTRFGYIWRKLTAPRWQRYSRC